MHPYYKKQLEKKEKDERLAKILYKIFRMVQQNRDCSFSSVGQSACLTCKRPQVQVL